MRLADFILRDMKLILAQLEAFAAPLLPAADMESTGLREHAEQILLAVARDLRTSYDRNLGCNQSMGETAQLIKVDETAAHAHALLCARAGFGVNQLAAEYRALRASVLRLWTDDCEPQSPDKDDMIRFDEAIDQALAESIAWFTAQVEQSRSLLLGMMSHDMRCPLQAIQMTASYLAALNVGENVSDAATRLMRSGARMQALLDDLTDFNRTKLGLGLNVHPTSVDLADVVADELDELRAAYPDREIQLSVNGNSRGMWDGQRLQQLLGNLVTNALKYGAHDTPVHVRLTGGATHVAMDVCNFGPAIESAMLRCIFDPLTRGTVSRGTREKTPSLGLGLHIASEIAKAHGGTIEARSDDTQTVFSVSLPRSSSTVR
ncbi:sensor histidine kinase [Burkholderia sp. WSM2232]|uniref:sensor histidine kinase n=1 Tax=Burkholderia sp. WSM2232 TaxID=944436 RepID=UPI000483BB44|nr:HAMP domain-containing sensor histidine kinase [Burkholderia sp. WSM2232]